MPTFGRYQTTDEIASSGPFTVYAAVDGAGGEARFAVKSLRTFDEFADPEILARQAKAFLLAAELQRSMAGAAPQRWAPIHEIGQTAEGVFYVTDLGSPLQGLIDRRKSLSARDLGAIIRGVAEGLIALRDAQQGRGHGRLRPGNVLLGTDDGPPLPRLIDPAAHATDAPAGEDLKALGGLLFELVAHRAAPFGTEIRSGPEWSSLGGPGEPLRRLCEQLINPTAGADTLTLEDVIAALEAALAVKDPGGGLPGWAKAAAAVVVLAGAGGAAWWFTRPPPPPPPKPALANHFSESASKRDGLIADIDQRLQGLQALLARSEEMGGLRPEFERAINEERRVLDGLKDEASRLWDRGISGWDAISDPDCCHEERASLLANEETLTRTIGDRLAGTMRFEAAIGLVPAGRTLSEAAQRVQQALDRVPPREVAAGEYSTPFNALKSRFDAIQEDVQRVSAAPGVVLSPGEEAPIDAAQMLTLAQRRADEALALRTEIEEFRRGLPGAQAVIKAVERARGEWRAGTGAVAAELRDLGEIFFDASLDEFGAREDSGEQALVAAWEGVRRWIEEINRSYESVVIQPAPPGGGEAAAAARNLLLSVRGQKLDTVIRQAERSEQFRDAKLPMFMEQRGVLDGALRAGRGELAELAQRLSSHLSTVEGLEARLAQGWRWEEADAQGATLSQRTQELRAAIESLGREPAMSDQRLQREATTYAQAVQASLARVLSVEEVSRLAGAPELLNILSRAGEAEVPLSAVMQAWAGLARLDTFPSTLADTQRLIALGQQSRSRAIAQLADSARRETLDRTVLGATAAAWRTLVNARLDVSRAEDVYAAFNPDLMRAVGVDPDAPAGLSAPALYNYQFVRLVERIEQVRGDAEQQRPQLMSLAAGFTSAVNGIEGVSTLRSDPRFSRAARRIGFIEAGKSNDPTSSGPAMRGWSASGPENFSSVVFTSPDGGASLTFIRLDAEDAEAPRYLATGEVSVGLLARVVGGLGQESSRNVCLSGMLNRGSVSGGSDNRDGPRSWVWAENQVLPAGHPRDTISVAASNGWIGLKPGLQAWPGDYPFYAPGVSAPPPSVSSPVNHVPVVSAVYVAALLGCRLPDEDEWNRAVGMSAGSGPRRGAQWKQQFDYAQNWGPNGTVVKLQARTWEAVQPHAGIFIPAANDGLKNDVGHDPAAQSGLWFEQSQESAAMFTHLMGNIAEWLCNDTNGANALVGEGQGLPDAAAVNRFVSGNRGAFRVIGGSSISPPGLDARTAHEASSTIQRQGASDLGFRLAFTVSGGGLRGANPAQKIAEDLRKLDFMPVAGR